MTNSFEKQSSTLAHLTISIIKADYQSAVDKKVKETAKKAAIKGFRPGHAPIGLIQKMYGNSILFEEVIDLVNKNLTEYVKENNLNVVGDPLPADDNAKLDFVNDEQLDFKFELGLSTDFTIDLSNITVEKLSILPSDAQVEEAIEDMRGKSPNATHPEESEKDDFLFGIMRQESTSFEALSSAIPLSNVKESSVFKFLGLEKGSKVAFDIQTIFETNKYLAMATGVSEEIAETLVGDFEFELVDITRNGKAELNQEFFDRTLGEGKASNMEEYKVAVKEIMISNYERETQAALAMSTQNELLKQAGIELPDEFLKKWLGQINEGKFSAEEIDKDYPIFARNLRLDLINGSIAESNKEDIKVEFEDIVEESRKQIRGYFGSYGTTGMEEFIDKMARDQIKKGEKNAQENMRKFMDLAFKNKVNEFILTKVNIVEKIVNTDEFTTIATELYKI